MPGGRAFANDLTGAYPLGRSCDSCRRPDPAPDLRWPPSGNFGEIRRLLQPTPHAWRQPPIKAFVGSSHRPGPRPQRPQDLMARRCHHADRGDGGICPRRLDRTQLANRPRFHALSADAVRCLLFRFISLILQSDFPLSDQLKFQQTSGSVLRDHFILMNK